MTNEERKLKLFYEYRNNVAISALEFENTDLDCVSKEEKSYFKKLKKDRVDDAGFKHFESLISSSWV